MSKLGLNNWTVMASYAMIRFSGSSPEFAEDMQRVPGIKFKDAAWQVPYNAAEVAVEIATRHGFDVLGASWPSPRPVEMTWEVVEAELRAKGEVQSWVLDGFLNPYQKSAITFGWNRTGCHIWHPAGAGKTVAGILTSLAMPGAVLVITRTPSRVQFAREIERFLHVKAYVVRAASAPYPVRVKGESWHQFRGRFKGKGFKTSEVAGHWKQYQALHGIDRPQTLDEYMTACRRAKVRPFVVVGWDLISDRFEELYRAGFSVLVCDECFVPGTLVETQDGPVAIERVQPGTLVRSVNLTTGVEEWKTVVRAITKIACTDRRIEVKFSNGQSFICTERHEVWTEEGYVEAGRLEVGTRVRGVRGAVSPETALQSKSEVLFSRVRGPVDWEKPARYSGDDRENLRVVRRAASGSGSEDQAEAVLRPRVFCELACSAELRKGGFFSWGEDDASALSLGGVESSVQCCGTRDRAGTHDGTEPDGASRGSSVGSAEASGGWTSAEDPRREGPAFAGSTSSSDRGPSQLHARTCISADERDSEGDWLSSALVRARSGVARSEAGDRDRRGFAQHATGSGTGRNEGSSSDAVWVVGVALLEQGGHDQHRVGSDEDRCVYDLEVADNHNYFANGILVSNCHRGKGSKRFDAISLPELPEDPLAAMKQAQEEERELKAKGGFIKVDEDGRRVGLVPVLNIAAAAARLARGVRKRIGLTATAISDRVRDLYGQLDTIEPNAWANATAWMDRYANRHKGTYGGYDTRGASNLEELGLRLKRIAHIVDQAETHRHLPPKRRQSYYVAPEDQCAESAGFAAELRKAQARGPGAILETKLAMAASRKRKAVIGLVGEHVASNHKVVMFTARRRDCDELGALIRKEFEGVKVWVAHGEYAIEERQAIVDEYMAYEGACVFVATGHAFGEALNLDTADAALFVMLPYTPGQLRQWEGRFHRASTKKPVIIYYVIAEGTVDEHIASILIEKLPAVEKIAEDSEVQGLKDVLANIDPNQSPEEFATKVLGLIDAGVPFDFGDYDDED
jgi:hypothetical protein